VRAQREPGEVLEFRRLRDLVDDAAERAAGHEDGVGALDDFQPLDVRLVGRHVPAASGTDIYSVDETEIAEETADDETIAAARLALEHRRDELRHVEHAQALRVVDQLARHHGDGLREILDRDADARG